MNMNQCISSFSKLLQDLSMPYKTRRFLGKRWQIKSQVQLNADVSVSVLRMTAFSKIDLHLAPNLPHFSRCTERNKELC